MIKFKKTNLSKIHSNIKGFYFRYFIPDILFGYKKILYLDSDTIICDKIDNIFNLKLNETIGAIKEAKFTKNPLLHIKELTNARFNTGVLLINTKRYKEKKYLNKILNFSKKYPKEMSDQPIVNVVLKNDFKYINKKWNFLDKFNYRKNSKINILHFNNFKPWKINHKSPHKSLYRHYRRKIDKLFLYDDLNLKNVIKKIISY